MLVGETSIKRVLCIDWLRVLNAEIELMEFKPSIIAAAVAISVTQDTQIVELTHKAFCLLIDHVEKL